MRDRVDALRETGHDRHFFRNEFTHKARSATLAFLACLARSHYRDCARCVDQFPMPPEIKYFERVNGIPQAIWIVSCTVYAHAETTYSSAVEALHGLIDVPVGGGLVDEIRGK